jgi:hypothetical protein
MLCHYVKCYYVGCPLLQLSQISPFSGVVILSVFMPSVIMLCHYVKCHYAVSRFL